jgi:hypothetical protein
MAVVIVDTETCLALRNWTGVETQLNAGFRAEAVTDVVVYSRDKVTEIDTLLMQGSDYSVELGTDGAVAIVPVALPPPPKTIVIVRNTSALQGVDFQDLESYDPAVHTVLHSRAAMRDAEDKMRHAHTLRTPLGDTQPILPPEPARINKYISFDASGQAVVTDPIIAQSIAATSQSSIAIGAGIRIFQTQSGKFFAPGDWLNITSDANPNANAMHGQVVTYTGTSLTMNVTDTSGGGTFDDWTIRLSGTRGPQGLVGDPFDFPTQVTAAAANIPTTINFLDIMGRAAAGDGGRGVSVKIGAPSPAKAEHMQSADGAWWNNNPNVKRINLAALGAGFGNAADDSIALNRAIEKHNTEGGFTMIELPPGTYDFTGVGAGAKIVAPFWALIGHGKEMTVAKPPTGANFLTIGDPALTTSSATTEGQIRGITFDWGATPTTGARLATVANAHRIVFDDIYVRNFQQLLYLGESSAKQASHIDLYNFRGYSIGGGVAAFRLRFGTGFWASNTVHLFANTGSWVPPDPHPTMLGTSLFRMDEGSWDTLQLSGGTYERFDMAFAIVAGDGMVYQNLFCVGTVFDYIRRWTFYLQADGGGLVAGVHHTDGWAVCYEQSNVLTVGVGQQAHHSFIGNQYLGAGVSHWLNQSNTIENISFSSNTIGGDNRLGSSQAAIHLQSSPAGSGALIQSNVGFCSSPYGFYADAEVEGYTVQNNALRATTAGYGTGANSGASARRRITNNALADGAAYGGYAGRVAINWIAPSMTIVNTTGHLWDIDIYGGVVTSIVINGVGLNNATNGTFTLEPGETIFIAASSAPSIYKRTYA